MIASSFSFNLVVVKVYFGLNRWIVRSCKLWICGKLEKNVVVGN